MEGGMDGLVGGCWVGWWIDGNLDDWMDVCVVCLD